MCLYPTCCLLICWLVCCNSLCLQSEISVDSLVDCMLLIMPPVGGDQLQMIKRGIMVCCAACDPQSSGSPCSAHHIISSASLCHVPCCSSAAVRVHMHGMLGPMRPMRPMTSSTHLPAVSAFPCTMPCTLRGWAHQPGGRLLQSICCVPMALTPTPHRHTALCAGVC